MNKLLTALILSVTALTAQAQSGGVYKKESKTMSFDACIVSVYKMTKTIPSRVIVSSDIVAVVRFQTAEGSMLATCSKPDQKIALVYTTNPL
jgi:hypothetical protein